MLHHFEKKTAILIRSHSADILGTNFRFVYQSKCICNIIHFFAQFDIVSVQHIICLPVFFAWHHSPKAERKVRGRLNSARLNFIAFSACCASACVIDRHPISWIKVKMTTQHTLSFYLIGQWWWQRLNFRLNYLIHTCTHVLCSFDHRFGIGTVAGWSIEYSLSTLQ